MPDPHDAKASIADLDVVTERRILLHQRRDESETHLPTAPLDVFYEPNDRFVRVGQRMVTITELSFAFQRGKREKTHVAAKRTGGAAAAAAAAALARAPVATATAVTSSEVVTTGAAAAAKRKPRKRRVASTSTSTSVDGDVTAKRQSGRSTRSKR